MPIKYKRNCATCRLSRNNPKLRYRISQAWFHRGDNTDESLKQIAKDINVGDQSIYNHAKKHITDTPIKTPVIVEGHIEKLKAKIAKETELAFDHDAAVPRQDYERVIDGVLAEGMDQMKKQGKTITISQLLTAAKIKADYQAKKRGQDVEIIKSMYKFSSGGKKVIDGTPTGTPASSN